MFNHNSNLKLSPLREDYITFFFSILKYKQESNFERY